MTTLKSRLKILGENPPLPPGVTFDMLVNHVVDWISERWPNGDHPDNSTMLRELMSDFDSAEPSPAIQAIQRLFQKGENL